MSLVKSLKEAFKFGDKQLRVFGTIEEPWFCGKDVAKILEYKRPTKAIQDHVKSKYKIKFNELYENSGVLNQDPLNKYEKNMIYIKEAGLYALVMKSGMEEAENFQDWVLEEVLPSIRKNGYYVDPNITDEKIKQLEYELKEKDNLLEEKENQLNRLHIIQKELITYKKKITKDEIIYIVTTADYARQGIYKVGRTKKKMKLRSSGHNNTHIKGDKVKVLREFKVNDSVIVERVIHTKLSGLLLEGEKEYFMCPYDLLESLVNIVVNNDEEENELVNRIVDTVYKLKQAVYNSKDWMQGIPEGIFNEILTITDGSETLAQLDTTLWTESNKKEFISRCLKEYIKEQDKVNQDYQMLWKTFQTFLVKQLSIPKYQFKATEWKSFVKDEINKKEKLSIKWRS